MRPCWHLNAGKIGHGEDLHFLICENRTSCPESQSAVGAWTASRRIASHPTDGPWRRDREIGQSKSVGSARPNGDAKSVVARFEVRTWR
jgi:hypothetical protein